MSISESGLQGGRYGIRIVDDKRGADLWVRQHQGRLKTITFEDDSHGGFRRDISFDEAIKVADAIYEIVGRERKGKTTTDNWEAQLGTI